jgi:hypothetical protein
MRSATFLAPQVTWAPVRNGRSRRSPHGMVGDGMRQPYSNSKYLASLRSTHHARITIPVPEMIPLQPVLRVAIPRRLEIATHVRLPDPHHLEIARRKVARARLQREVRMTERLLAQVIQAVLVVRESLVRVARGAVDVGGGGELRVKVQEAVRLVVERDGKRPILRADARCAVEPEPALERPLVPRAPVRVVVHALFHHHRHFPR